MKLVYLTLEAPREGQASYVHVHEIIAGLRKQGVDVTLFEPPYTRAQQSPALWTRLLHSLILQVKLWCTWPRGAVLYIRGHYLAYPSALIAKIFNIIVIHEVNGPYGDVFVSYPQLTCFRRILTQMQRWQYRSATGLIAVTKDLRDWLNTEGRRDDAVLISNGANTDIFKPNLPKPKDLPDHYVIFFGGLTKWHGVPTMLEAVKQESWPQDVSLVIIGYGQEAEYVRKAAQDDSRIIYLGKKPYKKIAPYIANALAGLVVITNPNDRSSTGVLPLKLYETLACGVPAIVSDLPGQADLIRKYECGIVLPDDREALSKAVRNLFLHPDKALEMGKTGHTIIVKYHSWYARSLATLTFIRRCTSLKRRNVS